MMPLFYISNSKDSFNLLNNNFQKIDIFGHCFTSQTTVDMNKFKEFFSDLDKGKLLLLALTLVILIFIIQNFSATKVSFLFFTFELPLFILITIVFIAGYLSGVKLKKDSTIQSNSDQSKPNTGEADHQA